MFRSTFFPKTDLRTLYGPLIIPMFDRIFFCRFGKPPEQQEQSLKMVDQQFVGKFRMLIIEKERLDNPLV